ncbi:aminodeoxychorismate/anthranilate synthase component II [Catenovulum sp. SM1970]|nr:aminodeoxychorismate/anthranilate synthase component II [Marinifaba aquimaris]
MANTQIFLLDNFDSFTYNLVDEIKSLGYDLIVYRNDIEALDLFEKMKQAESSGKQVLLLLSPGPGNPSQAGCMLELIGLCRGHFPILGICLGHQAIVEQAGGVIGSAGEIMHGKTSLIDHNDHSVFNGLSNPLYVARYHSLMATQVPECLDVIASHKPVIQGEHIPSSMPMAVLHKTDRMLGFQFHPESILTTYGSKLLQQSLDYLVQA